MRKRFSIILAITMLTAFPVIAHPGQNDQAPPVHVYEAYYKINYADLEEWTRLFYEHSVPILEDLQEEGILEGWSLYDHYVAGDYNVRFTARTWDWNALRQFWDQYLPRLDEQAGSQDGVDLLVAHYDEIWDIGETNVGADGPYEYMITSSFHLSFGDMDQWNAIWAEQVTPALNQAMEDGLLGGWVLLSHNTGRSENWRILYFFDEWDDVDDLFARVYDEGDQDVIGRLDRMIQGHSDQIWRAARDPR